MAAVVVAAQSGQGGPAGSVVAEHDLLRAAIWLAGAATGAVISWWLAARVLIPEYRPQLLGVDRGGDSSHPTEGAVLVAAFFIVVGAAFAAAVVVYGAKCSRSVRRFVAAALVTGVLLYVGLAVTRSESRCSLENYTQVTTCASSGDVLATDVAMVLVPGCVAAACLAAGGWLQRRRSVRAS